MNYSNKTTLGAKGAIFALFFAIFLSVFVFNAPARADALSDAASAEASLNSWTPPDVSLTPKNGDLSVVLLSQVLGNSWYSLFKAITPGGSTTTSDANGNVVNPANAGSDTVITKAISVVNLGMLIFVGVMLLYQISIGSLQTANDGTPLGKRWSSLWVPMRGPVSLMFLAPIPAAKGLSMIQVTILLAVYMSIGIADSIWSNFMIMVNKNGGQMNANPTLYMDARASVGNILPSLIIQQFIQNRTSSTQVPLTGPGSSSPVLCPKSTAGSCESVSQADVNAYWGWVPTGSDTDGVNSSGFWVWYRGTGSFKSSTVTATGAASTALNQLSNNNASSTLGGVMVYCSTGTADEMASTWKSFSDQVNNGSGGFWSGFWNTTKLAAGGAYDLAKGGYRAVAGGGPDARETSSCKARKDETASIIKTMLPFANDLAYSGAFTQKAQVELSVYNSMINQVIKSQEDQAAKGCAPGTDCAKEQDAFASQVKSMTDTASNLGWASSSFYYWTLASFNAQKSKDYQQIDPVMIPPDPNVIATFVSNGGDLEQFRNSDFSIAFKAVANLMSEMRKMSPSNQEITASATPALKSQGENQSMFDQLTIKFIQALGESNPIVTMQAAGNAMITAGESILGAAAIGGMITAGAGLVAAAITGTATTTAFATTGPIGAAVAFLTTSVVTSLLAVVLAPIKMAVMLAVPVGMLLIAEGATLAYIIPSLPSIYMLMAIMGWVFLVLELLVASAAWGAAFSFADGEGFAPPSAERGFGIAFGIVIRPILLTTGFMFAIILINVGSNFIAFALSIYTSSISASTHGLGPVGAVTIIGIAIATVFSFVRTMLGFITRLADNIPTWLGGQGAYLGETGDAQGVAQTATQKARGGLHGGMKEMQAPVMSAIQGVAVGGGGRKGQKGQKGQKALGAAVEAAKANRIQR